MSRECIEAVTAEYRRYKALAEGALAQLTDDQLAARANDESNSVATMAWHCLPTPWQLCSPCTC